MKTKHEGTNEQENNSNKDFEEEMENRDSFPQVNFENQHQDTTLRTIFLQEEIVLVQPKRKKLKLIKEKVLILAKLEFLTVTNQS